jgi:hypothetical protein
MRKRHHVVSEGYLRFFADGDGRLLACDKTPIDGAPRLRLVGTRDLFVRKHFSSYAVDGRRVDDLEDEWCRLENVALPALRRWIAGAGTPDDREAAKVVAALHFARSYGFRTIYDRAAAEVRRQALTEIPNLAEFRQAWRDDMGRDPGPGEAEAMIAERFDATLGPGSATPLERMVNAYNVALGKLAPLHVQALIPASKSIDFITGDSPFVYVDDRRERVGAQGRLAVGDATQLYFPLGPRLAVMFTTARLDDVIAAPRIVQELNVLVWRAAFRQVACHPATALPRALAMSL